MVTEQTKVQSDQEYDDKTQKNETFRTSYASRVLLF